MLAHVVEKNEDTKCSGLDNKLKPNVFHETFCKTWLDSECLRWFTPNMAIGKPNMQQQFRGILSARENDMYRGLQEVKNQICSKGWKSRSTKPQSH